MYQLQIVKLKLDGEILEEEKSWSPGSLNQNSPPWSGTTVPKNHVTYEKLRETLIWSKNKKNILFFRTRDVRK